MVKNKKNISFTGFGILSALSASLCCITPLLALIAGIGGFASTFSWLEPFRPYLIALAVISLGFAWYQKIKASKSLDCACESETKPSFWKSKSFLVIITVFAILMISFPYYSKIFYPDNSKQIIVLEAQNLITEEYNIAGMTCSGCEANVNQTVNKLPGIVSIEASHKTGKAIVQYDKTIITNSQIITAINSTGYKVEE